MTFIHECKSLKSSDCSTCLEIVGMLTFVVPQLMTGITVDGSSRLWHTGLSLWTHSELLKLSFKKVKFS